jgi:hypothetical protein
MNLNRIFLIHWNAIEAKQKALILKSVGYEVDYESSALQALKKLRNSPSVAVVIDLSRLPSQGRDIAINIRHTKTTRNIPIVFVDGDRQKVNLIKTYVPDALYTDYDQIHTTLKEAIAYPPKVTVIPKSIFEPYTHVLLVKKLGIKPNTTVLLIDPPKDFARNLKVPQNVKLEKQLSDQPDLIIMFVEKQEDLRNQMIKIIDNLQLNGKLWIAWRKKASGIATDVTETTVRKESLALGLVDYKVCRIDATWTGLLFTRRGPRQT